MRERDVPLVWRASRQAREAAWENGRAAAEKRLSRDCNPFDFLTERAFFREWDRGWRSVAQETGLPSNLRNLREERQLTQTEVARRSHLSQQAISHYEAGKRMPKYRSLQALSDALECTVDELMKAG